MDEGEAKRLQAAGWTRSRTKGIRYPVFGDVESIPGIKGTLTISGDVYDLFQPRTTDNPVWMRLKQRKELPEASQADLNHLFGVGKKDQPKTNLGETW